MSAYDPQFGQALSPREIEVYSLLLTDMSRENIAAHMGITKKSLEAHERSIWHKKGVKNRVGLMAQVIAEREGPR